MANKVNWVGIKPYKTGNGDRGPLIGFKECFVLREGDGPELRQLAPNLFRYMFEEHHVRIVMSQHLPSDIMREEVETILMWAKRQHPSKHLSPVVSEEREFTVASHSVCKKKTPSKRRC
jgi:hypothetical protein